MTYPNILFILADDLGCWSLGYTGNQDAITPHLDGMARQGMVIQNFFLRLASVLAGPCYAAHWAYAFGTWRAGLAGWWQYVYCGRISSGVSAGIPWLY